MSSDYLQPDFYRFNQDSIQLVKWIAMSISKAERIIDLGAGSGIIGIELARILNPRKLTLIELQKEFESYLAHNVREFLPADMLHEIVISSFSDYFTNEKYDLVVCNPPYYLPGQGKMAKNTNRAIARTFLADSWGILMNKIFELLAHGGRGYIVLKAHEKMYEMVQIQATIAKLYLKMHKLDSLMVLELFRLDEN